MRTTMLIVTLTAAALVGCSKEEGDAQSSAPTPTDTASTWLLASAPADAREIAAAKQDVAEGDEVVLRGRIGGRTDPMSTETGMFVMMDLEIPSCADMGDDDHCPTPWDYCCEPSDSLAENAATVLLVDASGDAIAIDLHDHGLAPLDEVIVVGTVGPRPDANVLTVNATAIHRVGG